jgi:hypothetical protein
MDILGESIGINEQSQNNGRLIEIVVEYFMNLIKSLRCSSDKSTSPFHSHRGIQLPRARKFS